MFSTVRLHNREHADLQLFSIDEPARRHRETLHDGTLVYHLLAFDPPTRLRLTVPLAGQSPNAPSVTGVWPSAA